MAIQKVIEDVVEKEEVKSRESRKRRERQPLGGLRTKLGISNKTQEYFKSRNEVLRWINDDPGRLESASEEDSYRFVGKSELSAAIPIGDGERITDVAGVGSRVSRVVGTRVDGSPVTAYLMAKPTEDYEEDQAVKAAAINKKEAAMRKGQTEHVESSYIPSTGIKIIT